MGCGIIRKLSVAALLLALWLMGCGTEAPEITPEQNLISDFTEYCFGADVDVDDLRIDARLVLDTINLPSANGDLNKLVLGCDPERPFGNRTLLEFRFPGILPADIDPGLADATGWKVTLRGVRASKCTTCYTNEGLAHVVVLSGNIADVTFECDPQDTLGMYIHVDGTAP